MKKLALALLLSLTASAPAWAQSATGPAAASVPAAPTNEPETLFGHRADDSVHVSGWFLAPTFGTTSFANTLAYGPGLRGGIYLNRRLAVGLAGNVVATDDTDIKNDEVRNIGTYGGLFFQYLIHSDQLLHVTVESTLGDGKWCQRIGDANATASDGCTGRQFLVFEPEASVELNLSRHVRLATGLGYRFAAAASGTGPTSREMSGVVMRSSVVFGSF